MKRTAAPRTAVPMHALWQLLDSNFGLNFVFNNELQGFGPSALIIVYTGFLFNGMQMIHVISMDRMSDQALLNWLPFWFSSFPPRLFSGNW